MGYVCLSLTAAGKPKAVLVHPIVVVHNQWPTLMGAWDMLRIVVDKKRFADRKYFVFC